MPVFSDHYIEEPYDLSKVLFIATANYLENIPAALRDRLEIIELSSYTELEKVQIAKEHLIPKQVAENGLKPAQLKIDDELILIPDPLLHAGKRCPSAGAYDRDDLPQERCLPS